MADTPPLLRFLGHSTVLLELDSARVLTDPVLTHRIGPLHRHAGHELHEVNAPPVDVVLVSHGHHDHLHLASLRRLAGRPKVIVPRGLGALVSRTGHDVIELSAGEHADLGGLRVTAVHAAHPGLRRPFGPASDALGFHLDGGLRVYFAGDTDLFPEMSALADTVDVALLPVWGWGPRLGVGHLDPRRAAAAVAMIRPRVAVPIHWGTFYPFAFARLWPHPLGEPPKAFAREVGRVAPGTEVRIVEPGGMTTLS